MQTKKSNRKRFQTHGTKSRQTSIRRRIRTKCKYRKIQKAIKKAQKEKTGISKFGILKCLQYASNFLGVFAEDQLENLSVLSFPSFLVVNVDSADMKGSHWIALRLSRTTVEIFDPLGFQMFNWSRIPCKLLNFLHRWSHHRDTLLSHVIQPNDSILCGFYCIAFVLCRHVISFKKFLNLFKTPERNDQLLINVFSYSLIMHLFR